jgi:hypothetical protein
MHSQIANKAIETYGGKDIWKNSKYIEAEVSVKGLLFTLKRRPFYNHAAIKMEIHKPFVKINPIGSEQGIIGVLNGNDVYLENENGNIVSERKNARGYFGFNRRLLYWDDLDMAYFANYAFWNYFTFLNLLMNEQIKWKENDSNLIAVFPDGFPTHSKKQTFKFDKISGKLIQHNYTADIVSSIANAANIVIEHKEENGLIFPSIRRVTPQSFFGNALSLPILVEITVHKFRLTNDSIL